MASVARVARVRSGAQVHLPNRNGRILPNRNVRLVCGDLCAKPVNCAPWPWWKAGCALFHPTVCELCLWVVQEGAGVLEDVVDALAMRVPQAAVPLLVERRPAANVGLAEDDDAV